MVTKVNRCWEGGSATMFLCTSKMHKEGLSLKKVCSTITASYMGKKILSISGAVLATV